MKILTLAGSAFTIILSFDYMRRERILRFEYPILILLSTAGMMLTISANDLISLYLALEFQSLALYVVAAFHRDHLRSTEAGLKYFVLGRAVLRASALRLLPRLRLHRRNGLCPHSRGGRSCMGRPSASSSGLSSSWPDWLSR